MANFAIPAPKTFKTAILSDRFYDGFSLPDYLK
jgi:hypothetical protein